VTILHLDSSVSGENSVSRTLTRSIINQLRAADPAAEIHHRDLALAPLPHFTIEGAGDVSVLEEFLAADTIVIGAPMYNFTVPSQLKAWIDRILIAGRTFHYTAGGPQGLTSGKRVIIALARGGVYDAGSPAAAFEHLESYLRSVFNFIGVEPEFVAADGVNISPDQRQESIRQALGSALKLAA
jgi:FMN-dependent NADH-azoreductase